MKLRTNQAYWDATSDEYQATHGEVLTKTALAWGVWRIPESELGILGDVKNLRLLELGCGAAQWTLALRQNGARTVGMDLSGRQLHHARRASAVAPLVQGNAETLPFRTESFDLVFCDHGAMTFARPQRTVAEAARVLKPNGRFAFCMSTPILDVCWEHASTTYSVPEVWARRWPAEHIWKLTKR
jgi:ubiquinone/menaquinone biosynthesis C-methylase UbiE